MSAQLKKRSHQNSENKLLSASHGTESFMVEALQVGFESGDTFGSSAATSRPAGSMTPDAAFGETTPFMLDVVQIVFLALKNEDVIIVSLA